MTSDSADTPTFVLQPMTAIVEAVTGAEPDLPVAIIEQVAAQVAPARMQLRRLAQALTTDPDLLTSGRGEGPRHVELLIRALLPHGTRRLVLPRCAGCGRTTSLEHRDGARRLCSHCKRKTSGGEPREPCAVCGKSLKVFCHDQDGLPRCQKHPPAEDGTDVILRVLKQLDTGLDERTATAAIKKSLPHAHQRRTAASQLRQRLNLLTGEGSQGSPAVISLIDGLLNAGAAQIVRPPCAVCGLAKPLKFRSKEGRCCRGCYEAGRQEPCSRCGQNKHVATRTHEGGPLCYPCMRRDPANMSTCFLCGRLWPWTVKDADGRAICGSCWRPPVTTCSVCKRQKPCHYSTTEAPRCAACGARGAHAPCSQCSFVRAVFVRLDNGDGLCESCARRREPCVDCGRTMRVYGRIDAGPLCTVCYRKHPSSRRHCVQCGTHERLHHFGLCAGCAAPRQLHAALANHSGDLRPELEPVFSALADYKASSLLLWLSHEQPKQILRTLAEGTGPVTHATLDAMPESRAVTYLRAALVATDVLPARDEQLASLERWLSSFLQRVEDSQERALISRFATWVHLRRLRSRARRRPITHGQCQTVRHDIYAAVALQRWLRQRGSSLSTCDQAQIDDWLAQAGRKHIQARSFLTWSAARGHIPTVHVPPRGTSRGAEQLAEEDERWEISKRLLHDADLALTDRVAGCLVVLYGQPVSRIARLTTDKILTGAGGVQLQLGSRPVEIPEPLGSLLLELARSRQAFAVLGQNEQGPWLFPGGRAGQAMTASHLTVRLNRLGIRARASRNTALLDLAAQIPASVLSDVLGISITCAVAWSHDAGNTRLGYAADVARRGR